MECAEAGNHGRQGRPTTQPVSRRFLAAVMTVVLHACGIPLAAAPPPADLQAERSAPSSTTSATTTEPPPRQTSTTTSPRPHASQPSTTLPPTTLPTRDCTPTTLDRDLRTDADPRAITLELSRALHPCADELVLSDPDPQRMAAAAREALRTGTPLLVTDPAPGAAQFAEIERLAPRRVVSFGVEIEPGPWRLDHRDPEGGDDPPPSPTAGDEVWFVRAGSAAAVIPAAAAAGATVVAAEHPDARALPVEARERLAAGRSVRLVGPHGDSARWQVEVARGGLEIPGGGQLMFPGRRLLALYGSIRSSSLGVLGEAGPEESLAALRELAPAYAADGRDVLPTFEIIATVAAQASGDGDDYSEETPVGALMPWVETAAREDAYVLLDLQPGRADFLSQAKRYEELLRLPHVGLALDPEWRLEDGEEHLDQIGSVSAGEINRVVGWLAELVRAERLPQKLLVVHQFQFSMITDRHEIRTPSELAVVIQMDGQGPLPTKYATYRALVEDTEDAGWRWGWKQFIDEDRPMADPRQVLDLEPAPVFVSIQ